MLVAVFNGWAAGAETWELCSFRRDWLFSYIEELDGLPSQVLSEAQDGAVLVGFSMGGAMALKAVMEFPGKIKGLVLISATPRMMELKEENWRGMSERRLNALYAGTRLVFVNDPSLLYAEENLNRGLDFLRETDLRADLKGKTDMDFPVEIIQSERDGIVRVSNAWFLKEIFPTANVTILPGSEHVVPVLAPEAVDAAVARVLAAVDSKK